MSKKDTKLIAYKMGIRDTLDFLAEEYALDYDLTSWLFEQWVLKNKGRLKHFKEFNKKYE